MTEKTTRKTAAKTAAKTTRQRKKAAPPPAAVFSDQPGRRPSAAPPAASPAAPRVSAKVGELPRRFADDPEFVVVWRTAPPLGQPAMTTIEIARAAGTYSDKVLPILNRLADAGCAQRLTRDGHIGYFWRRL